MYLNKWGFDSQEWIDRFQAGYILNLVYVFDLFYMNVIKRDRKAVVAYPWETFLPDLIDLKQIYNNGFISETQKKLLTWIFDKDAARIMSYYCKKKVYQRARKIKSKLIH